VTSRRQFLKAGALASAGLFVPWKLARRVFASTQVPQTPLLGGAVPKWVDPLPTFVGTRVTGANLTVTMEELQQQVLPSTFVYPVPFTGTYVWGYKISNGTVTRGPLYPTYTIEATRGTSTTVKYVNNLVGPAPDPYPKLQKYLTVDQTLHWADPLMQHPSMNPYIGPVPAVVHLHGGEVQSEFDGGPDEWFTPDGLHGPGYRTLSPTDPNAAVYFYPNSQEATTLWFHDHTLGATRLNVYAGLAGFYFLRDWANERTDLPGGPADSGGPAYEVEIVIQDRMFDTNGQWFFPDSPPLNPEHPFWLPEFLGDAIVVNGKTWPFLNVQPRRYRFRFLNGSNARFYRMWLENMLTATPGPVFWQIGTDGGLLNTPVKLDPMDPVVPRFFLLAPGERADMIIDFSGFAGQTLTLRNNARAPYPKGAAADPGTTGQIMQFRVAPTPVADTSYNPSTLVTPRTQNPIVLLTNGAGALAPGVTPSVTRRLTLNEVMGMAQPGFPGGPLEVLVNNTKWDGTMSPNIDPTQFPDGVTEKPGHGSTEVWEIINLTADAHPIHLHLVQFQLLNRQNFNVNKYTKAYGLAFPGGTSPVDGMSYPPGVFIPAFGPPLPYTPTPPNTIYGGNPDITRYLQGPARPPEPNEVGWKDTVIMYPGEVTRIVARWMPTDVPVGQPGAFPFDPTTGPGYVWHCHIIDHEDNEMMRPYNVTP